ncbi:MAG: hypothetical protein ACYSTY_03815 [Planctomycetota bacterium]|jgi:hypothetical protein
MSLTRASIYCLRCSYVLDGLDRQRCPECGNAYDLANSATYETMPRWARWRRRLFRSCIALAVLGMLGGAAYAACRIPPSVRVVEVKETDRGGYVVILVLKNRSLSPLSYPGYGKTIPDYGLRRRASGTWGEEWSRCGTGLGVFRLMPGESVTFSAPTHLYANEDRRQQVGLRVRHTYPTASRRRTIWSDAFTLGGDHQG